MAPPAPRADAPPAGRPGAAAGAAGATGDQPGRQASLPAPDVAVPAPAPAELIGRTGDEIERTLGAPVFVRRDPPAEFWRYRHASCVLELIFYDSGGAQRLRHMQTRTNGGGEAASAACLEALVRSRPRERG